jgi:hypothetical protein
MPQIHMQETEERRQFIEQLACDHFHVTDGACCATHGHCQLAAARRLIAGEPVQRPAPHANLNRWYLAGFMIAVLAIYGWGFYAWEREMAARDPANLEASR